MAWIIDAMQEEIITKLKSSLSAYELYEGGVPSGTNIRVDESGAIKNYITYQFSDVIQLREGSFAGVRYAEYFFVLDTQSVSGDPAVSRKIRNHINDVMLGYKVTYGGELGKERGVRAYMILDAQQKPQAYVSPSSFRVSVTADLDVNLP